MSDFASSILFNYDNDDFLRVCVRDSKKDWNTQLSIQINTKFICKLLQTGCLDANCETQNFPRGVCKIYGNRG